MSNSNPLSTPLRSQVWQRTGWFTNEPGILELTNGRLTLVTEQGTVFAVPLSAVKASYAWYRFKCGCTLHIGGKSYAVDFMRPNGGRDVSGQLASGAGIGAATHGVQGAQIAETVAGMADLVGGRAKRQQWHAALTGPGAAS